MLAMMAAPSMVTARGDRLAFSYTRVQVADAITMHTHAVRPVTRRSASRGLRTVDRRRRSRARPRLRGSDGTDNTATPGPDPWPGCDANQWAFAGAAWAEADATNSAAVVDAVNVNATNTGIIIKGRTSILSRASRFASVTLGAVDAFALCTTERDDLLRVQRQRLDDQRNGTGGGHATVHGQ